MPFELELSHFAAVVPRATRLWIQITVLDPDDPSSILLQQAAESQIGAIGALECKVIPLNLAGAIKFDMLFADIGLFRDAEQVALHQNVQLVNNLETLTATVRFTPIIRRLVGALRQLVVLPSAELPQLTEFPLSKRNFFERVVMELSGQKVGIRAVNTALDQPLVLYYKPGEEDQGVLKIKTIQLAQTPQQSVLVMGEMPVSLQIGVPPQGLDISVSVTADQLFFTDLYYYGAEHPKIGQKLGKALVSGLAYGMLGDQVDASTRKKVVDALDKIALAELNKKELARIKTIYTNLADDINTTQIQMQLITYVSSVNDAPPVPRQIQCRCQHDPQLPQSSTLGSVLLPGYITVICLRAPSPIFRLAMLREGDEMAPFAQSSAPVSLCIPGYFDMSLHAQIALIQQLRLDSDHVSLCIQFQDSQRTLDVATIKDIIASNADVALDLSNDVSILIISSQTSVSAGRAIRRNTSLQNMRRASSSSKQEQRPEDAGERVNVPSIPDISPPKPSYKVSPSVIEVDLAMVSPTNPKPHTSSTSLTPMQGETLTTPPLKSQSSVASPPNAAPLQPEVRTAHEKRAQPKPEPERSFSQNTRVQQFDLIGETDFIGAPLVPTQPPPSKQRPVPTRNPQDKGAQIAEMQRVFQSQQEKIERNREFLARVSPQNARAEGVPLTQEECLQIAMELGMASASDYQGLVDVLTDKNQFVIAGLLFKRLRQVSNLRQQTRHDADARDASEKLIAEQRELIRELQTLIGRVNAEATSAYPQSAGVQAPKNYLKRVPSTSDVRTPPGVLGQIQKQMTQ